jgi:hypothetical protein
MTGPPMFSNMAIRCSWNFCRSSLPGNKSPGGDFGFIGFGPLSKVMDQITKAGAKQYDYEMVRLEIFVNVRIGFPNRPHHFAGKSRSKLPSE